MSIIGRRMQWHLYWALAVPLTLVGVWIYLAGRHALKDHVIENLDRTRIHLNHLLTFQLARKQTRAEDFASDGQIVQAVVRWNELGSASIGTELNDESKELQALHSDLMRHLADQKLPLDPQLVRIELYAQSGDSIITCDASSETPTLTTRISETDSDPSSRFIRDLSASARHLVQLNQPIRSRQSTDPVGTISLYFSLSDLEEMLRSETERFLEPQNGDNKSRSEAEAGSGQLQLLLVDEFRHVIANTGPEDTFLSAAGNVPMARFTNSPTPQRFKTEAGNARFGFLMPFPQLQWTVIGSVDMDRLLHPLRQWAFTAGGLLVFIWAGGWILTRRTAAWLSRPIVQTAETARRVAQGDWNQRVPVPPQKDELRDLTESVNAMVSQLQSTLEALQRSERQRKLAQDLARIGYWEWDIGEDKIHWSEETRRIFGFDGSFTPTPTTMDEFLSRMPSEDQAQLIAALDACRTQGTSLDVDHRFQLADGHFITVSQYAELQRGEPGTQARLVASVQDITEHQRLMRDFQLVFDLSPDLICAIDQEGCIIRASASFLRVLGRDPLQAAGRPVFEWVHPEDVEKTRNTLANQRHSPGSKILENRCQCLDGTWRVILWTYMPIPNEETIYCIGHDVTERHRAEKTIEELNQSLEFKIEERTAQLVAINEELESFSYSVSHDLRSPLRAIAGFSEALADTYAKQLDARGQDYLRRIQGAAERMGHLIDDLLMLARVSKCDVRRESVQLSRIVERVLDELQKNEPARAVDLQLEPKIEAFGDPSLLQVLLRNLLENAWKFSSGSPDAIVRIEFGSLPAEPGRIVAFIRDQGVGFDMRYAGKLFGPFQRLHKATDYPGTGVGLATVRRIARRHGGRVWAESEPGKGATFFFELPAQGD